MEGVSIKKKSKLCTEVTFIGNKERRILLSWDVHFDNPHCNREILKEALEQCKKNGDLILFNGDLMCCMGGKYDPRRSKSGIRPEYNKSNYIDLIIDDLGSFLAPYAENILAIGYGNHETSILDHLETDLIERLIENIRMKSGISVAKSGYHGFIILKFKSAAGGSVCTKILWHHHGKFGGVVTKGVLGVMRHAATVPDADIIFTGHTHDHWVVENNRFRVSKKTGEVTNEPQLHIKSGTLKEEFLDEKGWAIRTIVLPKSMSAWWLKCKPFRDWNPKRKNAPINVALNYEKFSVHDE